MNAPALHAIATVTLTDADLAQALRRLAQAQIDLEKAELVCGAADIAKCRHDVLSEQIAVDGICAALGIEWGAVARSFA